MNHHELLETAASCAAGLATALAFLVLYVALAAPVAETALKLVS